MTFDTRDPMQEQCPDNQLADVVEVASSDPSTAANRLRTLVEAYPGDGRLYFLLGSVLVGLGEHTEAYRCLTAAVAVAPEFHLARFQLGFFQLTSGEPAAALVTLAPLDQLGPDHFLCCFAEGLRCLIDDQFDAVIENLQNGIERNSENEPLNGDMQKIIHKCQSMKLSGGLLASAAPERVPGASAPREDRQPDVGSEEDAVSATSALLAQLSTKNRR